MTDPIREGPLLPQVGETPAAVHSPGETALTAGQCLGKYVIRRRLGQGGMGVVYEAEDTLLQRCVAVKVLRATTARDGEATQRFLREARAVAKLHHPNVVTIHEIDEHEGGYFLVMELVRGGSMHDRLQGSGRLGWEEATRVIADACRGLVAAHAAGVVHRDVKPANLLMGANGAAKLADFGMARSLNPAEATITGIGGMAGTPAFMSPEQCRGEGVDARSDVYSLGATYYTLLTGALPFPREAALEIMLAHCDSPAPDPRRRTPSVPDGCARIVQLAMAKDPAARHPSAQALLVDLETQLTTGEKTEPTLPVVPARTRRRRALWVGSTLFAVLAVGSAVLALLALRDPMASGKKAEAPVVLTRELLLPGQIDAGGAVQALAFSRDDRLLAWATADKNAVCVMQVRSGRKFAAALEHRVHCLALADDGRTVAVGTSDSQVRFWDTTDGLRERPSLESPRGSVATMAFSPDGKLFAAGIEPWKGESVTLRVWRLDTNEGPLEITKHTGTVDAVAFSPDGQTLASAGRDGVVHLWSTSTWKVVRTLPLEGVSGWGLAFSPDSKRLVVALVGGAPEVPTWNAVTGERSFTLRGHSGEVVSVAYAPGGRVIATGSADGVRLWDAATGKQRDGPFAVHQGGLLRGLGFSNDGTVLVSGASDQFLNIRHVERLP